MRVHIDCTAAGKPLRHHWRTGIGGGRVAEALRADFQRQLNLVQHEMPFAYLRMHGLFHDDMMICGSTVELLPLRGTGKR